jgi:hypothetical protein
MRAHAACSSLTGLSVPFGEVREPFREVRPIAPAAGDLCDQLVITVVVQDGDTFSFGYRRDQQVRQADRSDAPAAVHPGGCRKSAGSSPPPSPGDSRSRPGSTAPASWTVPLSTHRPNTSAVRRRPGNMQPGPRADPAQQPRLPDGPARGHPPPAASRRLRHLAETAETQIASAHPHMLRHTSQPCWTPTLTCAMCRSPPGTPIRAPRCGATGPAGTWTATRTTSWPPTWASGT